MSRQELGAGVDFLVVGAGIIGLSIAREIKRRQPTAAVAVIEKELDVGEHTSGRNSGVLHAGFYYAADSLKARFCRDGNRRLRAYCEAKGLPVNACGKLVVVANDGEQGTLDVLFDRARANGIDVKEVSDKQAREIEPRARTKGRALWSPTTASIDPGLLMHALKADAIEAGIFLHFGAAFLGRDGDVVRTSLGPIAARYVVNAAGLYADKIALLYGFSQNTRILPFKGVYLHSDEPPGALATHVYPVPNLKNPFLGVHFTVTVDRRVKIGPTAMPAFWREHYGGLGGFNPLELGEIIGRQLGLAFGAKFDFLGLAREEMKKYRRSTLVSQAARLVDDVRPAHYRRWGQPGIRAQLLRLKERELEMDFVIEGDARSMHVLNAVSPGLTCALPFAEHIVDEIEARLGIVRQTPPPPAMYEEAEEPARMEQPTKPKRTRKPPASKTRPPKPSTSS
ncbi:MAG: L-2-hydroxyglutarate oxidase [Myxococcales bacterium]|nr:MAG: L-2-hydroxyglutarate oxidase [Myxococcales bacterium]